MLLFADAPTWASDYPIVAVLIGLVGLVGGAELLVRGAVWIALNLGMSQMAVGLTLVSIGTSLPELLVTLTAADDHADLAMGNVTSSSGSDVPMETRVRPTAIWLMPSFSAIQTAPRTSSSAPPTRPTRPISTATIG